MRDVCLVISLMLLATLAFPLMLLGEDLKVSAGLRGLKEGDPAPDFELTDTAGKRFKLSEAAKSTVVILFWDPSMDRSQDAYKAFVAFADGTQEEGVIFLAIREPSDKDKEDKLEGDAASVTGKTARVLPDVDRVAFGKYGVVALPSTLVIAPGGVLRKYFPLTDSRYPLLLAGAIELAKEEMTEKEWLELLHPKNEPVDPILARATRLTRTAKHFHERGSFKMAERIYRKALKVKADFGPASLGLGFTLLQLEKSKEAYKAFELAGKTPELKRRATLGRGISLRMQGKAKEARAVLEALVERAPSLARAHYELGQMAEERKETQAALDRYRTALEILFQND